MKDVGQRVTGAAVLRRALPYLRMFRGKLFVVKASGGLFGNDAAITELVEQIEILSQLGVRIVLVHGGGPQSTQLARDLGAEPRFVHGRRVTDDRALEVATYVLNGVVNTKLLAAFRAGGLPAVGISGVDAGLIRARRRPPVMVDGKTVDFGHVGDIEGVDASVLTRLLDAGFLPVVSPLSADDGGAVLNVNADSAAAAIAVALGALKLILLTEAPGVLEDPDDPTSLVSFTDLEGLARLREEGAIRTGMLPKTDAVRMALAGGVPRAHIISYRVPHSLLVEVLTNEGSGTMVVRNTAELPSYIEEAVMVGGLEGR